MKCIKVETTRGIDLLIMSEHVQYIYETHGNKCKIGLNNKDIALKISAEEFATKLDASLSVLPVIDKPKKELKDDKANEVPKAPKKDTKK